MRPLAYLATFGRQPVQPQGVGAVRERPFRRVVYLDEDAAHAHGHRRARQRLDEARLAAGSPAESSKPRKRVPAIFFRTEAGGEPVREWIKRLASPEDRRRIGEDLKTVEFGWPVGMPVCRPLEGGIYEVRTGLSHNRIARAATGASMKGGCHEDEDQEKHV